MKKTLLISSIIVLMFSGCSFFTIGAEQGYCEEQGCDYSDAGVCGSPYNILKNKEAARKIAYNRIHCNCKGAFDEKIK
jgi:hypothetical protein